MSKNRYDLVVSVGEYTNQQGETKKRYKNIGAVIQNDKGFYMMLDRTFNPAGLPNPDNRSNCLISMFEPKQKDQQQQQTQTQDAGFDNDIPF